MRVPRLAVEVVDGVPADLEVRLVRLAHDQRAGREQPRDDDRVPRRPALGEGAHALGVPHPRDVEVVLDRDRDSVEREAGARVVVAVGRVGVGERRLAQLDDRVHLRVRRLEPGEVRLEHLAPADLARPHAPRQLMRGEGVQLGHERHLERNVRFPSAVRIARCHAGTRSST